MVTLSADGQQMRLHPLPGLVHLHKQPANASDLVHHTTTILPGEERDAFVTAGHTTSPLHGSVLHINALLPCSLQLSNGPNSTRFFGVHVLSNADRTETTTIGEREVSRGRCK
jgi:hypothetical protein